MGFGKDGKGVIFRQRDSLGLTTLAANTFRKQDNPPTVTDNFRVIKSEGFGHIDGATFVDTDGPLGVFLVSDDLSTAEILEAYQTAGAPLNRGDVVGSAQAERPIYYLGLIKFSPADNGVKNWIEWSKTIRWTFNGATNFAIAVVNIGSGALTTGGSFRFYHTAFGVWVGA